ncbi:hypothetical protein BH11PSE1_BH11PSE1_31100 [soil metagenome]
MIELDRLDVRDRRGRRLYGAGVAVAGLVMVGLGGAFAHLLWRSVEPKAELLTTVVTILAVIPAILLGLRLFWGGVRSAVDRKGLG